jgi:hypothetical protein
MSGRDSGGSKREFLPGPCRTPCREPPPQPRDRLRHQDAPLTTRPSSCRNCAPRVGPVPRTTRKLLQLFIVRCSIQETRIQGNCNDHRNARRWLHSKFNHESNHISARQNDGSGDCRATATVRLFLVFYCIFSMPRNQVRKCACDGPSQTSFSCGEIFDDQLKNQIFRCIVIDANHEDGVES